jgi:hypothetical protein
MDINDYLIHFKKLKEYCEKENYKGWDPFDGLNSKIFQATPLKQWNIARLFWIQGFKRSPINLRKLLLVPKEYNAKGIGLFLTGYCNIYKAQEISGKEDMGKKEVILEKINFLAELLISMQAKGYSGACWGYNFDWQNRVFFQPKETPTVVVTSFVANALFEAYEVTNNTKYFNVALSSSNFILKDLNRFENENGLIFSYSPLDKSKVFNASLLGARLLARCFQYTKESIFLDYSKDAVKYVVSKQHDDGSWLYGEDKVQNWVDSFHTGYNLECLFEYKKYTNDNSYFNSFEKGMTYYLLNFFENNGLPKYYNRNIYPIDIHSPAQFIVTIIKTEKYNKNSILVEKVLDWTLSNMQSKDGYFYYQINKIFNSQIPYMRWAQAWMFYSMSILLNKKYE